MRSKQSSPEPAGGEFGVPPLSDSLAEFFGTAIFITIALSIVTLLASPLSPLHGWIANAALRRLVIGAVTVSAVVGVVYSPLGKRSGGHLNPAMTIGFLCLRKLRARGALAYIACQLAGAVVGATVAALVWGRWARAIHFGASAPGPHGALLAVIAELVATFLLASVVFHFVDRPRVMRFTPVAAAITTVVFILVEAPASTTSLNPARSLGPAVWSHTFGHLWIYLIAPPVGALLAAVVFSARRGSIACGKLVHDDAYACRFRDCAYRIGSSPST